MINGTKASSPIVEGVSRAHTGVQDFIGDHQDNIIIPKINIGYLDTVNCEG